MISALHENRSESLASKHGIYSKLPREIWILGFVSIFMDISTELIHSLLAVFMTAVPARCWDNHRIEPCVARGSRFCFRGACSAIAGR